MKKLMGVTAVAVVLTAPAFAQTGGTQLTGQVQAICSVTDPLLDMEFASMTSSSSVSDNFSIQCNDADGATMKLQSSEGGLENDDNEDQVIHYVATISGTDFGGLTLDTAALSGTTQAANGANDIFVTATAGGSTSLASGQSGFLNVSHSGGAVWAGGYSDTLTLQLTAN